MRYIILSIGFVSLLLAETVLFAADNISLRPEIQENLRQLQEMKSCPGCDLSGAIMHRMDLAGANLEGANLAGAQLNLADLAGANLKDANLQGASLGGVDLGGADLSGANLTGAVIEGAYLVGAKMDGQVVVQRPYAAEGGPGAGEKVFTADQGKSKHLPFTNEATVTRKKMKKETASSMGSGQAGQNPAQVSDEKMSARALPADPLPKKSKQLNMMEEVVIVPGESPKKISDPSDEGSMMEPSSQNNTLEELETVEVAAVELEEATEETIMEQKDADPPVVEEMINTAEEETMMPPAPDPEAEKKKLLVEKLLDDNRCVACDLSGVDLAGKDLEDADLERVNLQGANLRDTDLEGSNLKGANLRGADLRDADLREADMYRADISGADLTGAKLRDALIDSLISTGVIGANFEGAIGNQLGGPFIRN